MEKIEQVQKETLIRILKENNINENIIKNICDIEEIEDLSKRKYNYLLLLLKELEGAK